MASPSATWEYIIRITWYIRHHKNNQGRWQGWSCEGLFYPEPSCWRGDHVKGPFVLNTLPESSVGLCKGNGVMSRRRLDVIAGVIGTSFFCWTDCCSWWCPVIGDFILTKPLTECKPLNQAQKACSCVVLSLSFLCGSCKVLFCTSQCNMLHTVSPPSTWPTKKYGLMKPCRQGLD